LDIDQQLTTYHTTFLDLEEIRVTSLLYHSQIHCDQAYSVCGFTQAFLYRKRSLQQNGEMKKRNGKEGYINVECKRLQGHPLSPPPPSRCDNRGSLPTLHFRPPPLSHPQQDYSQILATSLKVEDGLQLGVCEYGN
jgi:hypothetical protein